MGRTHEALLQAEEQYRKFFQPVLGKGPHVKPSQVSSATRTRTDVVPTPRLAIQPKFIEYYDDLKTNLAARYPNGSVKTILFSATYHGVGCSTTAVNFAAALSKDPELKVLLAEVNLRTPSPHKVYKAASSLKLKDLLAGNTLQPMQFKRVMPWNFYVMTSGGNHKEPLRLLESGRFGQILKAVRHRFDFVILDGPPVLHFAESRVLSRMVDGTVLVIHSGGTRREVAMRAKQQLEDAGAKILGVILNKRRYYIPEWIYRRL